MAMLLEWTKIYTMVVVFCCNSFPYVLFIQYYSETRSRVVDFN